MVASCVQCKWEYGTLLQQRIGCTRRVLQKMRYEVGRVVEHIMLRTFQQRYDSRTRVSGLYRNVCTMLSDTHVNLYWYEVKSYVSNVT